jgi:hypothetical protein
LVDKTGNPLAAEDLAGAGTAEEIQTLLNGNVIANNVTQSNQQKLIIWGSPGNEITRVVPLNFVVDANVLAYLNVVEPAKGSYVSGTQLSALQAFVAAEKAAGRWSLHKRLYLPIWGSSSANAVDLVTATSGTWVNNGNVVHGAGFVKNTGGRFSTAGRFDTGASPSAMGMTDSTSYLVSILLKTADAGTFEFPFQSSSTGATSLGFIFNGTESISAGAPDINVGAIPRVGIFASGRNAGTTYFKRRTTATNLTSAATSTTFTPPTSNFAVTGLVNNGAYGDYAPGMEIGLYTFSLGMSQAAADQFTSNLKTLWETCTGLTLP